MPKPKKTIADQLAEALTYLMAMEGGEPNKSDTGSTKAWRKAEKALERWRTNRKG